MYIFTTSKGFGSPYVPLPTLHHPMCVVFFFFYFLPCFSTSRPEAICRTECRYLRKWWLTFGKFNKIHDVLKKICTIKNTWGVLKVISESGLWERTLLAILMIPSCKKVVKPRASWVNIFFPNNCIAFLELKKIGQKLQQIQYIITVSVVLAVQNLCLMKSWETHICTWPLLVRTEKMSKEA